jgi:hypothetical protein
LGTVSRSRYPGPQYGYMPPPGPGKYRSWPARNKVLTGVLADIVLIIIGSIADGASGSGHHAPQAAGAPSATAAAPSAAAPSGAPASPSLPAAAK